MSRVEGFAPIPTWMMRDKNVSRRACLVYASLSSRSGLGAIYPSQSTIAEETGVSERTVRAALAELEALGVVERRTRRGREGRATGLTTAYVLHPNGRIEEAAEIAGPTKRPAKGPATSDKGAGNKPQPTHLLEAENQEAERSMSDVASDALPNGSNPQVVELCDMLAVAVTANGHKVGVVGKTWWAAADRLMRLDGYTFEQIAWMIRWATADEFWSANIRSMPTLREKFSTLVLQAKRDAKKQSSRPSPNARTSATLDMARRLSSQHAPSVEPKALAS